MAKSPVARLTEAVLGLEEDLRRIDGVAKSLANDIVRQGDLLAAEMKNDIDLLVKQISDEIARETEALKLSIQKEYEAKIEAEVARAERLGKQNLDNAVEAVVEEIVRIVKGA